jgi:hypoxanthine-DNA glycosylase
VDANTRILILGSLPGEVSLARGQYYAHPRNQFWRLMEEVAETCLGESYERRLQGLRRLGIGLWDSVATATRSGSLDAAIRDPRANPLGDLAAALPRLKAVAFNGGASSKIGRAALGNLPGLSLLTLPSSSPALAMAFERKLAAWRALRPFLAA